ncbi:hypothetical protein PF002_g29728, partial [Phytophthora fragariae]
QWRGTSRTGWVYDQSASPPGALSRACRGNSSSAGSVSQGIAVVSQVEQVFNDPAFHAGEIPLHEREAALAPAEVLRVQLLRPDVEVGIAYGTPPQNHDSVSSIGCRGVNSVICFNNDHLEVAILGILSLFQLVLLIVVLLFIRRGPTAADAGVGALLVDNQWLSTSALADGEIRLFRAADAQSMLAMEWVWHSTMMACTSSESRLDPSAGARSGVRAASCSGKSLT